jgi:tRNA uridine 5-carboxymethylaminomethyl modification enzyme
VAYDGGKLEQWLKRPQNTWRTLPSEITRGFPAELWDIVEVDLKYAGYIARQEFAVAKLRGEEKRAIPQGFSYDRINGLRIEARQKLANVRPSSLSQAARIPGVTQADLALLSVALRQS